MRVRFIKLVVSFFLGTLCFTVDVFAQSQRITVVNGQGVPVSGAKIEVHCDDPDKAIASGSTNAQGVFLLRIDANQQCYVTITKAGYEEMDEDLIVPVSGQVSAGFVLHPIAGKRNQINQIAKAVRVTVLDSETKKPVPNVSVILTGHSDPIVPVSKTTAANGEVSIETGTATAYDLHVHHDNYYSKREVINEYELVSLARQSGYDRTVEVKRRVANRSPVWVFVEGRQATSTEPLKGAQVSDDNGVSAITGPDGMAQLDCALEGEGSSRDRTCFLTVSADGYFSKPHQFKVPVVETGNTLMPHAAITLHEIDLKHYRVTVVVSGTRTDGTTELLKGARVSDDAAASEVTGADGTADLFCSLRPFEKDCLLRVSADGYETQRKIFKLPRRIDVSSPSFSLADVQITLKKIGAEVAQTTLMIKVTNKSDGKPISGASVALDGHGNSVTDSNGYAEFTLSSGSIKGKTSVRATVTKSGFAEGSSDIYAALLKPSEKPIHFSIQIEPPKTGQDSIFLGTWNGTGNAKGITVTFNEDYTMTFSDTRPAYQRSGRGTWYRTISLSGDCVDSSIGYCLLPVNGKLKDGWGNFYVK